MFQVSSAVLSDLTNPALPVNIDQETIQNLLKNIFPAATISGEYVNEDSQVVSKDQRLQTSQEQLIKQPQLGYGELQYNENVYEQPQQQMPQNEQPAKHNIQNSHKQILQENQQAVRRIPFHPYQRIIQEMPEQHMDYRQPLNKFQQTSWNSPLQTDYRQTGTNFYNVPEQMNSQLSESLSQKMFNNEHPRPNEQVQQTIEKYLHNLNKNPEQEQFQNYFQHIPKENPYYYNHAQHNEREEGPTGVAEEPVGQYPPNVYQTHLPYQTEEQQQFQNPFYYLQPPSYDNFQSSHIPKNREPLQDQPERVRRIQTGQITVLQVAPDSSS